MFDANDISSRNYERFIRLGHQKSYERTDNLTLCQHSPRILLTNQGMLYSQEHFQSKISRKENIFRLGPVLENPGNFFGP